jgi:lipopolysaccharide transport system ATP-binding protein
MTRNSIRLNNVNLHYSAVAFKERSLKALVAGTFTASNTRPVIHDIHALKNICVEIAPGERVGLLGHNGAGKSTFLKMVAGLYPISSGSRHVEGIVRSLFDLSLGFEPDASGRENILYRGLLLGLTPKFMRSVEEEIVAFADIGEFIDYPIKTYSAGMQVRLAFSISTMVGGDILLLDEVIGAGDANFMRRAKARITSLIEASEILMLATHDFGSLRDTCDRIIVLHQGEVKFDGPVDSAIKEYGQLTGASA